MNKPTIDGDGNRITSVDDVLAFDNSPAIDKAKAEGRPDPEHKSFVIQRSTVEEHLGRTD